MQNLSSIPAISCSPRAGGNSDQAVSFFQEGLRSSGKESHTVLLRNFNVQPCISCHRCEHDPKGTCFLEARDDSPSLFKILLEAPVIFFAAPIYFYHLPAQAKAFIDRSQCYWIRHDRNDPEMLALPKRKAHIAMVAARPQGEKLFDGSLLTLKYFLRPFNIELGEQLLFYGIDSPAALRDNAEAAEQLRALGQNCAAEMA